MLRTDDHAKVEELAHYATVPVINGLTDLSHPCQIMADLLTVIEHGKALPGLEFAWLGDGNNVLNSIVEAAGLMKFNVRVRRARRAMNPMPGFVAAARAAGARIDLIRDAVSAVAGARSRGHRHLGVDGAGPCRTTSSRQWHPSRSTRP